jgi:hypothetical protein
MAGMVFAASRHMQPSPIKLIASIVTLSFTGACGGVAVQPSPAAAGADVVTVQVGQPPNASAYASAKAALVADTPADTAAFLTRWHPDYLAQLPYDPSAAVNLPLIQQSSLQLNADELAVLAKSGFTISARQAFGTFFMGYVGIYANDLPLFVSGDSVLHAVHRSYDEILKSVEYATLQPSLNNVITGMRTALAVEAGSGVWPDESLADVDEYLTVAYGLAMGQASPGNGVGGNGATITSLIAQATAASGEAKVTLFGESREVDFSQFTVRGHYAAFGLETYFRAMMWLGRTDLRLLGQKASGEVEFHRRQFVAAALLAKLVESVQADFAKIDRTLRAFLGESDNMMPTDFAALRAVAGVDSSAGMLAMADEELARAIVSGGFGIQRIASQLLFVVPGNEGAPLDRAFLLLGQRFVLDSQVLSNVVYDRMFDPARPLLRMMPDPLDVAFAALGNSGAAELLADDLKAYPAYPQALHQARVLVDQHEPGYWTASLYTSWLGALRAASPAFGAAANPKAPPIVATAAWTKRILQMQLASWAELRHDNLLYAKQSYTGIPVCEFPDAYVEPIPALWHALADLGNRGAALCAELGMDTSSGPAAYFTSLASTTTMLEAMALQQEQGVAFTADQMAFINQAVEYKDESVVCATIKRPAGWYPNLFYTRDNADSQDTLIADVHTQPADAGGTMVGKVLHVGTGFPRLLVVTFNTCAGPRAYAGVVSAYHETVTSDFQRLTDEEWSSQIVASPPPEVPWLADLVTR